MNISNSIYTMKLIGYTFITVITCASWCGGELNSFEIQQSNALKNWTIAESILRKTSKQAQELNTPSNTRVPAIEKARISLGKLRPRILFEGTTHTSAKNGSSKKIEFKENTDPQKSLHYVEHLIKDITNAVKFTASQEERNQAKNDMRVVCQYYENNPYLEALAHKNDASRGSLMNFIRTNPATATSTTSTALIPTVPQITQTTSPQAISLEEEFAPFTQYFPSSTSSQGSNSGTKRPREPQEDEDSDVEEIQPPVKRNPTKSRGQKAAETRNNNANKKAAENTRSITSYFG